MKLLQAALRKQSSGQEKADQKTKAATSAIKEQAKTAASTAQAVAKAVQKEAAAIDDAQAETKQLATEQEVLADQVEKTTNVIAEQIARLNDWGTQKNQALKRSLASRQERFDRVSRDVSFGGDVQSNLGALRGLAGYAGMTGIEQGLGVVGEVSALTEELPRLKEALTGLPSSLASAAEALGPAGIAVVAVVGAIAIAAKGIADQLKAQQDLYRAQYAASRKIQDLVRDGFTTDEAQSRISELRDMMDTEQARIAELEQERQQGFERAQRQNGDLAARLGILVGGQGAMNEEMERSTKLVDQYKDENNELCEAVDDGTFSINDAIEEHRKLVQQILASADAAAQRTRVEQQARDRDAEANRRRINEINQEREVIDAQLLVLREGNVSSEELTAKTDELTQQLNDLAYEEEYITGVMQEAGVAAADYSKEIERIQNLQMRAMDVVDQAKARQAQVEEDRARQDARAAEDIAVRKRFEQQDYNDKILKLTKRANDTILAAREMGLAKERDSTAKMMSAVAKVASDYRKQRESVENKYRADTIKADADFAKRRRRAEEDLRTQLFEAEQENNVLQFLKAQQSAQTQRDREAQDFDEQQQERETQHQQELEDLRRSAEERRAELVRANQEEIAAAREATRQKIQQTRQALAEQIKAEDEARRKRAAREQVYAEIRARRQEEDRARQDAAAEEATKQQLIRIAKEIHAIETATSAVDNLTAAANQLAVAAANVNAARARSSSSRARISRRIGSSRTRRRIAFANEGVVTEPTIALLGEKLPTNMGEAVVRFDLSQGIASRFLPAPSSGGKNGGGVHVNYNPVFAPNVGDIATGAEVSQALNTFAHQHMQELGRILMTAINQ